MQTVLVVVHVFLSIGLIVLILMQHGKGADAGAAFGSGASATVFGAQGSANFLSRTTAILAALFFITSLGLAWLAMRTEAPKGVMAGLKEMPPAVVEMAPAAKPDSEVPTLAVPAAASEVPMAAAKPVSEAPAAEPAAPAEAQSAAPMQKEGAAPAQ
jgi:preprotein translocase subunit SecG